jgi:hypothetical protein
MSRLGGEGDKVKKLRNVNKNVKNENIREG